MSLRGGLESNLLHVLECLTLQLFSYLYKSPTNLSTHTNSVACIINYQRLSSLDFLFRREPTFALPVEMMGEQKGDSKLEVRNKNVCLSLLNYRQANYSKAKNSSYDLTNVNEYRSLLLWQCCSVLQKAKLRQLLENHSLFGVLFYNLDQFSASVISVTLFPVIMKDLNGSSKLLNVANGVPQGSVLKMLVLTFQSFKNKSFVFLSFFS